MLRSAVISWRAISVNGKLADAISRIKRDVIHAETLQHEFGSFYIFIDTNRRYERLSSCYKIPTEGIAPSVI
jgi:hypothetical protein